MSTIEPTPSAATTQHQGAVAALASTTPTGHQMSQLIAAWLGQLESDNTRSAYQTAMRQYWNWCMRQGLDPLSVGIPEADMYGAHLKTLTAPTGGPLSAKSRAHKLSAVSSFYRYLVRTGAIGANPFAEGTRPKAKDPATPTNSLTTDEVRRFLAAADEMHHPALGAPLVAVVLRLMLWTGARVSEVCGLNTADLGEQDGMRTLVLHTKGGKTRVRPIPAQLHAMLDHYRVHAPAPTDADAARALFRTQRGGRIYRQQVNQLITRVAKHAGLQRITPHSMRHAFHDLAKQHGVSLEARRDAMAHSSAAVTQLYDHVHLALANDPAHIVAAST